MKLHPSLFLALLACMMSACGEGDGAGTQTDTTDIGGYSLTVPQALSTLPGVPVSNITSIPLDYGMGSININLSDTTSATSGLTTKLQLQPLTHLSAPSVGSGIDLSSSVWQKGWNATDVEVTVIDDFATPLTTQSPGVITGPVTLTKVKNDATSSATANYEQYFRHSPRPYRNTLGLSVMSHGDIVAGIAAGDENVTHAFGDTASGTQLSAFSDQDTNMTGTCTLLPSTSALTCDKLLFAQATAVKSTVTYRLAPGIARSARLVTQPVILGTTANTQQQWADISGAMTNASKSSKVLNLSLGANITNNDLSLSEMLAVLDASPYTTTPEAVFTVAAGNNSGPCNKNQSSTTFNGCNAIAVALAYQSPTKSTTLVVGALDSDGKAMAKYSNRAGLLAQRYLLAPGNSGYLDTDNTGIAGTSFAAPRVAGAVAILRGMFPTLSAAEIANAVLLSANKDINDDGSPDFTGVSLVYGHGKLDLMRAINYLRGTLKLP
jgi:hypothetical protein